MVSEASVSWLFTEATLCVFMVSLFQIQTVIHHDISAHLLQEDTLDPAHLMNQRIKAYALRQRREVHQNPVISWAQRKESKLHAC